MDFCRFISIRVCILSAILSIAFNSAFAEEKKSTASSLLHQLDDAFAEVFEKVAPSVVVIEADKKTADMEETRGSEFFLRNPHANDPSQQFGMLPPPSHSDGSGFIARADGYIFTNNHVVAAAEKLTVKLKDGRQFTAKLIGADDKTDIAVLKIEAKDLPVLELGNSDAVRVGQLVCAIGSPYNLDSSFTCGWVSAKGRTNLTNTAFEDYIQTDAFINPGNSGGPLFDVDGKVIGMNTLINGIGRGLAFAIPSNMMKEVGDQLIASGKIVRSWLGIRIETLNADASLPKGIQGIDRGVLVQTIEAEAPAYKSDLRPADVITQVDGVSLSTARDLQKEILKKKVGQSVQVTVWRDGKTLTFPITTGQLPGELTKVSHVIPRKNVKSRDPYGLQFQDINKEIAEKLNLNSSSGAMVTNVLPDSPAALADIQREDIITEIDSKPVNNAESLKAILAESDTNKGILLFMERKGKKAYAVLKTDK